MSEANEVDGVVKRLDDDTWYWVEYDGLFEKTTSPALYKKDIDCFYTYAFGGVKSNRVKIIRQCV